MDLFAVPDIGEPRNGPAVMRGLPSFGRADFCRVQTRQPRSWSDNVRASDAVRFSILIFMDRLAGAVIALPFTSCCVASTARTYAGVWRAFTRWCGARGHLARPARSEIVAVYLVELRHRGRAVATIRRALGVIDAAHA